MCNETKKMMYECFSEITNEGVAIKNRNIDIMFTRKNIIRTQEGRNKKYNNAIP